MILGTSPLWRLDIFFPKDVLSSKCKSLVASASVCVSRQVLLLLLRLLRVPHTLELGSSPLLSPHAQFVVEPVSSFLLLQSWSVCCWGSPSVLESSPLFSPVGLLPKCSLLLFVCWNSPGCFQDHGSATMKRFKECPVPQLLCTQGFIYIYIYVCMYTVCKLYIYIYM